MTLTFLEIDARFPGASVLWDRDVAPTLDWEPRFVERDGVLYALGPVCWKSYDDLVFAHGFGRECRCLTWEGDAWISHARQRSAWYGIDRSVHPRYPWYWQDESKQVDGKKYAALLNLYMTDVRDQILSERYRQPRWLMLRQVLGANRPR